MRKDQQLSEKYKKSKRFEDVLSSMNEKLYGAQNQIMIKPIKESYPTIHVLGAPRSGTTLATQLISSFLDVGYINNLIAAFWKAPLYGIELSKKLLNDDFTSNFTSDYGRTNTINEPHEFGYFWNHHLKYDSLQQQNPSHENKIDWQELSLLIKNMTYSFEKPLLFKSFLLGFHAHKFYTYLPQTKYIYIKRNLLDNVISILNLRKNLNGDINIWGSIKPLQYNTLKDMTVYEQIVGQILCIEHAYLNQLSHIPKTNKSIINYEDLCDAPKEFLNKLTQESIHFKPKIENFDTSEIKLNAMKVDNEEVEKINKAKAKILNTFPELKPLKSN